MDPNEQREMTPSDSDGKNVPVIREASEISLEDRAYLDDPESARKLLRKLDLRVLPILMILWFLTFIDRVNIANAKVQGMEKGLGMKGNDYNVALTVFFATFIVFEVPSNMILGARLPWLPPRIWLSLQVLCLALFTVGQGLVRSYGGILAMRLMVGAFEAGLWRMSILAVANALASAFGGLFAYAIINMNGDLHRQSWRWVFIIEGSVTAAFSILGIFTIVNWPEKASFLSPKELVLARHLIEKDCNKFARMDHLTSDAVKRCLFDWKIWINVFIYAFTVATTYSINLFGPTLIQNLNKHYTSKKILLLTAPIFLVSAVFCLASAWVSDRLRHRSGIVLTGYLVSFIGFGILLTPKNAVSIGTRYMAIYFVAVGGYISLPILWTMMANNLSGTYKTAFGSSMQIGLGSVGGIIASSAYQAKDAPLYHQGHLTIFLILVAAFVLVSIFVFGVFLEKKARNEGKRDYRLSSAEINNMGDDHPNFELTY